MKSFDEPYVSLRNESKYSLSKMKKGSNFYDYSQGFQNNFQLPPIYETPENKPFYGGNFYNGQYESFEDYEDYFDDCYPSCPLPCPPPCEPTCPPPCVPCYPCDPCAPYGFYEKKIECDIKPIYAKKSRHLPLALDLPIPERNPCPPPKFCEPRYLPTIYRRYQNRIGNPKILAEYVDILDSKCCPRRVFSKEYSDQDLCKVGYCYTYKTKRKDKPQRHRSLDPKIIYREPKKYVINEKPKVMPVQRSVVNLGTKPPKSPRY
ncbi:unnamed protein product [Brachionus calyciflorus]|uniref:Uncharacterized protein n=1 Tax=Brachionus calyciflorus TaxID=104777 RepID=A0A813SKT5_9BILA|nr:unnamed protein product [Brachionus calyciflorus]